MVVRKSCLNKQTNGIINPRIALPSSSGIYYGDICHQYLRYYIFYVLLRFLMISKGSWVALETCSAESPIASNRCAVSVLVSCLPSGLKAQKLLAQGVWGKTIEKGSICHDERVAYRPFLYESSTLRWLSSHLLEPDVSEAYRRH